MKARSSHNLMSVQETSLSVFICCLHAGKDEKKCNFGVSAVMNVLNVE